MCKREVNYVKKDMKGEIREDVKDGKLQNKRGNVGKEGMCEEISNVGKDVRGSSYEGDVKEEDEEVGE